VLLEHARGKRAACEAVHAALAPPAAADANAATSGTLCVTVLRGAGLRSMETFGKNDVYCTIAGVSHRVGPHRAAWPCVLTENPHRRPERSAYNLRQPCAICVAANGVSKRTQTIYNGGGTPVWEDGSGETLEYKLQHRDAMPSLEIGCFDEDIGKDDFIGSAVLELAQMPAAAEWALEKAVALTVDGSAAETGQLHLRLRWTPDPPDDDASGGALRYVMVVARAAANFLNANSNFAGALRRGNSAILPPHSRLY
jgi:hypothetical protein